jgi:hypothetical protein
MIIDTQSNQDPSSLTAETTAFDLLFATQTPLYKLIKSASTCHDFLIRQLNTAVPCSICQ